MVLITGGKGEIGVKNQRKYYSTENFTQVVSPASKAVLCQT